MSESKKSSSRLILIVVILLVAVVGVFALLNHSGVEEKRQLQDDAIFLIQEGGQSTEVTMADIESLEPQEIVANYKKSGKDPEQRHYTGVPFAQVLTLKGIDAQGYSSVVFTAADGYASALPIADALNAENCYIIIAEEGQPLGKKEDGGSGPFRMILPNDQFSQRWCSFLLEVSFQ